MFSKTFEAIIAENQKFKNISKKFFGRKIFIEYISNYLNKSKIAQKINRFLCGWNCGSTVRQPEFPLELHICSKLISRFHLNVFWKAFLEYCICKTFPPLVATSLQFWNLLNRSRKSLVICLWRTNLIRNKNESCKIIIFIIFRSRRTDVHVALNRSRIRKIFKNW